MHFGNFEVFYNDRPVKFARSKTKEMFAYLVDRNGAMCSLDMIYGNLWPEEPVNMSKMSLIRSMLADMKQSFEALGLHDIVLKDRGSIGINVTKIDCDYYKYLKGDNLAANRFRGEYMEQYSFADVTRAELQGKYYGWN